MERISRRVKDKRVLRLIRKYLQSGIMIEGIKVMSEEGTPQGGPLSPLLSNIMLDEVDKELEKRAHKFCRFADDSNIYVKSKKAGYRVMKSMTKLLEGKLKLKVNQKKSEVGLVTKRKFLGFSFYSTRNGVKVRIHEKSYKIIKEKLRTITNRNWGTGMEYRLRRLNEITIGWLNYFSIADASKRIKRLEEWIRRRLRACIWKQ